MALTATSALAGSPGGVEAIAHGVYVAAGLVFLLAYRELLNAASGDYSTLRSGLTAMTLSLTTAFAVVVLIRALVAAS